MGRDKEVQRTCVMRTLMHPLCERWTRASNISTSQTFSSFMWMTYIFLSCCSVSISLCFMTRGTYFNISPFL